MLEPRNQEWLDQNSNRRYPLAFDATCKDTTGAFALPSSFLVSLYLNLAPAAAINPAGFFLQQVGVFSTGYSIRIGYWDGAKAVTAASGLVARISHTRFKEYRLTGIGDFRGLTGTMVIGDFEDINRQPAGEWNFDLAGGRLDVDAIRPQLQILSGIAVEMNGQVSDYFTGDIVFTAGKNMRFNVVSGLSGKEIIMDAIEGEGLNAVCVCADQNVGDCIQTINGIPPTPAGDFLFLGSNCLQIDAVANGLQFVDTCADPCCGPTELEVITRSLETINQQITTLEHFLIAMESRAVQIEETILASTFGDRGCTSCPQ